jgi:hypothetical protein
MEAIKVQELLLRPFDVAFGISDLTYVVSLLKVAPVDGALARDPLFLGHRRFGGDGDGVWDLFPKALIHAATTQQVSSVG